MGRTEGGRFFPKRGKIHGNRGEKLSYAVVQLARDAAALFILHTLNARSQVEIRLLRRQVGDQDAGYRFIARKGRERKSGRKKAAIGTSEPQFSLAGAGPRIFDEFLQYGAVLRLDKALQGNCGHGLRSHSQKRT